jgi:putative holliday junction resolvase
MGRLLAIDYGLKRTGIAVSDPMRIIATALDVVESQKLIGFLKTYFQKEQVDELVLGLPKRLNNQATDMTPFVNKLAEQLRTLFPDKPLHLIDERFTTVIAQQAMIAGGMKKKDRQVKGNTDKVSATIILQDYMSMRK